MHKHPGLLDGWALCSDYCFNVNPFYSRDMFAEFVQPYLKEILDYYRANGYYSIKHTDGNVMPILDMIVDCAPRRRPLPGPPGGVDLAEAKRLYGDRVCLIGNVNCGLMQTGTERSSSRTSAGRCARECPATATSSPPPTAPSPAWS